MEVFFFRKLPFQVQTRRIFAVISMSISDTQLQQYVNQVFARYDRDGSGQLNVSELDSFFNEVFALTGQNRRVNMQEAMQAMRSIDYNRDGQANRQELFSALKQMLGGSQGGYGNQGGNCGHGNNNQQGGFGGQQGGYGGQQGGYGGQQGGYGGQQGGYGGQQGGYGNQQGGFSGNQGNFGPNQCQGGFGNQPRNNQGW